MFVLVPVDGHTPMHIRITLVDAISLKGVREVQGWCGDGVMGIGMEVIKTHYTNTSNPL